MEEKGQGSGIVVDGIIDFGYIINIFVGGMECVL